MDAYCSTPEYGRGYDDWKQGYQRHENPYPAGTTKAAMWLEGWLDARDDSVARMRRDELDARDDTRAQQQTEGGA